MLRIRFLLIFVIPLLCSAQIKQIDLRYQALNLNEPTVAINPANPNHMVAASNIDIFFESKNKGELWTAKRLTSDYGFYGDPVLHFTRSGHLYITHLSKTPGKEYGDWFDRIVVDQLQPTPRSYSVGYNNEKMQDKPWMSSDESASPFAGSLYVTWTEFDVYGSKDPEHRSRIRFSALRTGKSEFSQAITVSDTTGDCLDGDNTLEGATSAVGADGTIYTVWAGLDKIWFDKSTDGGKTWGTDRVLAEQPEGWDMRMPNIMRANGMPFIINDFKRNTLYVTWADEHSGNADIWLKYSTDGGDTWSDRLQLNTDETKFDQYFPNLALDPETGRVYVAYYDQRWSNHQAFYDIYLSEFNPENQKIRDYRLTESPISLPGYNFFYGDYLDIDISKGYFAVSFANRDLPMGSHISMVKGKLSDLSFYQPKRKWLEAGLVYHSFGRASLYIHPNYGGLIKVTVKSKGGKMQKEIKISEHEADSDIKVFIINPLICKSISLKAYDTDGVKQAEAVIDNF